MRTPPSQTIWTLRTLAECLLATPKGAPINEGLARDLAHEALNEVAMAEQSAETLRELLRDWRSIVEGQIEGEPLIENILYWLIEDVAPPPDRVAIPRNEAES